MIQSVSVLSIAAMAVVAAVTVVIPIILFIILNKKVKCRQTCVLVGAGTFVVFALILETLLHQLVFHFYGKQLTDNIYLYALYGGLAAGLFEEVGRFISMKLFMKKDLTKANALMYGIGHGGAEMFLVGGMTYFSNIVISVLINIGQFEPMLATLDETAKSQVIEQYSALWNLPAGQFLLAAVERILALAIQICLSYIVYRAVKDKKTLLLILAVAIHFAFDAGLVIILKKTSALVAEVILFVAAVCFSLIVLKFFRAEKENIETTEEM